MDTTPSEGYEYHAPAPTEEVAGPAPEPTPDSVEQLRSDLTELQHAFSAFKAAVITKAPGGWNLA